MILDQCYLDEAKLREWKAELERDLLHHEQLAQAAEELEVGLDGPIRRHWKESIKVRVLLAFIEIALKRASKGYILFDRQMFEHAVDCCGEIVTWTGLSESLTSEKTIGNVNAEIILTTDVITAAAKAAMSGLFTRFEVATTFDMSEEDARVASGPFTHYLFGVCEDPPIAGMNLYQIAVWNTDEF